VTPWCGAPALRTLVAMTPTGPPPLVPGPLVTPGTLRVGDVPELLASIPTLVGFRPRESLVLVGLGGESGRRVGLTMRVDLPPPGPDHAAAMAGQVAAGLLVGAPRAALVVVFAAGPGPARPELVAEVTAALEARDVPVRTAVWAEQAAAGAAWACYDGCCAGRLADPATSTAAVTGAAAGHVVYGDREELEALVVPPDPARVRRREQLILAAGDAALVAPVHEERAEDAGHLVVLADAVRDAGAGDLRLDDDRVVALAAALTRPPVRDSAMARCAEWSGTDRARAAAAETLWLALCRELPDPEAAEAAVLLAACGLLRGDGALANVALDRAERSWPGHRLAGLLRRVAARGMEPGRVREWLGAAPGPGSRPGP
jgi:hypothetical protein